MISDIMMLHNKPSRNIPFAVATLVSQLCHQQNSGVKCSMTEVFLVNLGDPIVFLLITHLHMAYLKKHLSYNKKHAYII